MQHLPQSQKEVQKGLAYLLNLEKDIVLPSNLLNFGDEGEVLLDEKNGNPRVIKSFHTTLYLDPHAWLCNPEEKRVRQKLIYDLYKFIGELLPNNFVKYTTFVPEKSHSPPEEIVKKWKKVKNTANEYGLP